MQEASIAIPSFWHGQEIQNTTFNMEGERKTEGEGSASEKKLSKLVNLVLNITILSHIFK